jgi:hypothetical protein
MILDLVFRFLGFHSGIADVLHEPQ